MVYFVALDFEFTSMPDHNADGQWFAEIIGDYQININIIRVVFNSCAT